MTVLLTTANFPDVMLPALHQSPWYALFFMSYLFMGLYFLLNVLLATIFSGYKRKLQERSMIAFDYRQLYLEKYFDLNDNGHKGYLTRPESKAFFAQVLNFKYENKKDYTLYRKLLKILDKQGTMEYPKWTVIEFLMKPGFM